MPNYRRARIEGATLFFTVVTFDRRALLTTELALRSLRGAWKETRGRLFFRTQAICILPDHLHCIWTLPDGDRDFSGRWRSLKSLLSRAYLDSGGWRGPVNASRREREETGLWQRRFWEHWIRDEEDLRRHIDYIHYNPVKHGYVRRVTDWPWSSFHRFVRKGWYEPEWGETEPEGLDELTTVGE
ncbi:MAG TPA: transposase [Thermoanaerobaculia bacterium]|nr:transposase [Thermoanaerobaculia bacterium]